MTRAPSRRLLAIALASALSLPAWAQSAPPAPATPAAPTPPAPAASFTPFTVQDIRIDGLQRIGAGTVFTYLPVERGDTLDQGKAAEALRALYKTGFFEDVRLDRQGNILVITVAERPAINKLTLVGNKDIKTEDLLKGLKEIGLSEGETFNLLNLDRLTQELNRQYNNRGKYNVEITPSVERLDRNRINLTITIKEGKAARIRHINLIGNDTFPQKDITHDWESHTTNWLSWYRQDDQYSREKLSGDIEKLTSWYLDRGYIDFSLDSTQVAISGDRRDMFITAGMSEGEVFNFGEITVSGDTILPKEEIQTMVSFIKPGGTFSRAMLDFATSAIRLRLANIGYAFAQINPVPRIDRDKRTVAIDFQIQPGPRVRVRRIVFKGNTRTADPVLRREMRQFEGTWYSQAAIDRGKVRLDRLGYFEEVNVDKAVVPGTNDQVDVTYTVKETNSGSVSAGLGYSQLTGINLSLQLSENNFLGTGNRLSIALDRSTYQRRYEFSFMNPYFTDSGLSLGYNVWWREFDYSSFNVASYSSNSGAFQVLLGIPLSESNSISLMAGVDSNQINAFAGSTPDPLMDYLYAVGDRTFRSFRIQGAWARDTRNNYLMPTIGSTHNLSAQIVLPGSTISYYKLQYDFTRYWPLNPSIVLKTATTLGFGDSYGKDYARNVCYTLPTPPTPPTTTNPNPPPPPPPPPPSNPCLPTSPDFKRVAVATGLPFFENFYAGGINSTGRVRGFVDNTLGPYFGTATGYHQPLGGSFLVAGSIEAIFPKLIDSPAARVSAFLDFGNVYNGWKNFHANELRASVGVALLWRSPMGPLSISYAIPVHRLPGDQVERLQFTITGGQL